MYTQIITVVYECLIETILQKFVGVY